MQALDKMDVSFAFPTRTIVLAQDSLPQRTLDGYQEPEAPRH